MEHWSSPNGCHDDCPACEKEETFSKKLVFVCSECGSKAVSRDATAAWSVPGQCWELVDVCDQAYCEECDKECDLITVELG